MPTHDKYTRTLPAEYVCTLDAHSSRYKCTLDATRHMQLPAIQVHQRTADGTAGAKKHCDDAARDLRSRPEGENLTDGATQFKLPNLIQSPSFRCAATLATQAQLPGCFNPNGTVAAADVCSSTSPSAATLCHGSSSGSKNILTSLFSSSCVSLPPVLRGREQNAVSCIPAHGSSQNDSKLPNISAVRPVALASNKNTRATDPTVNATRTRRRPVSARSGRPTRFKDMRSKQSAPAACSPSAHALLLPLRGYNAHAQGLARKQKRHGDNCSKQNHTELTKLPSAPQ